MINEWVAWSETIIVIIIALEQLATIYFTIQFLKTENHKISVFCFFNGSIFDVIGQKLVSWNYKIFDYVNRTRIYINFNRYVRCRLIQLISRSNVQVIDCVCCRLILLISIDNIHGINSLNILGQIVATIPYIGCD